MRREVIQTLATRLLLAVLAVVTGVLTARLLGPEGRGQYFLALTITATGLQLACLGLHSGNTYMVAGNEKLFDTLNANSVWAAALFGSVAAAAGALLYLFDALPRLEGWVLAVALIGIPPALYYLLGANLLVGVGKVSSFNRFELVARLAPLLFIIAVAWHASPLTVTTASVAGSAVVAGLLLRETRAAAVRIATPDRAVLVRTLRYGLRAYAATLIGFVVSRLPIFMLGRAENMEGVGQLSVAMQISDLMAILPATIGMLLFPQLVRNPAERRHMTRAWLSAVSFTMIVACLIMDFLADPLLPWLFGQEFSPSVAVLRWMLPGVFFVAPISIISQSLAAIGIPWSLVLSWCLGAVVLVLLGAILIPERGAVGAAMAWSGAYLIVLVFVALLLIRHNAKIVAHGI